MKNRLLRRMLPLVAAAAALVQTGRAQEYRLPAAVMGFYGEYDYGHLVPFNSSWDLNDDPYANEAEGLTGGVTMIFPKIGINGLGLSTRIGYGIYAFSASQVSDVLVDGPGGTTYTASVRHGYDLRSQAVQMDLTIYAQFGDLARFEIGPWGGIGFFPRSDERFEILTAGTPGFADGGSVQTTSNYYSNVAVANAGGVMRASVEIPLFAGMTLIPSAHLRVAGSWLSNKSDGMGIVGLFGGGLALMLGKPNGVIVDPPPPAPVSKLDTVPAEATPPPTAPTSALEAKVDLYSRDLAGRHRDTLLLVARRTLHRMEVPLDAELRFERNSASLPARYAGYSAGTRADFALDAFAGKGPGELHRQALNVIGMRLGAAPAATVTLTGWTLPDEPKWFGRARAEAVREYLMRTWGVGEGQVKVGGGKKGSPAARAGVTIASSAPGILDPIATEWVEQEVNAAPIGLEPEITAPRGVKEWHASIRQGMREIGVVRSTDSSASGSLSATGLMASLSAEGRIPELTAELIVEDSTGARTVARDALAVMVEGEIASRDGEEHFDRTISRYFVPGERGEESERMIRRIVDATAEGAAVTVRPVEPGAIAGERARAFGERFRELCAERGKRNVSIGAAQESAPTGEPALHDEEDRSSPIEIIVMRGEVGIKN